MVGAGPAGLAAALFLHRNGHRVRVFERFVRAAPVGSGLILQPTGLAVLHALGLLPAILRLGARIDRLHGCDAASGRTVLSVAYADAGGSRFGLAVHRAALFGVLHEAVRAQAIPVETSVEAEGLERGGKATLLAARGRHLGSFDLVVDASGRGSKLRRFTKNPVEPKPLGYGALWASLPWISSGFDPHALLQRYRRASVMIGVLPIGRPFPDEPRMAALFWSLKPEDLASVKAGGLDAWKARVLALWPECAPHCEAIKDWNQLVLARYGHHTLSPPAGLRLAVIGDAGHSTSPQLGQGANMALLDAAALAHALGRSTAVPAALEAYVAMRSRHVRLFQALSRIFTPFYQSDSTVLPLLRDRLVASMARVPPIPWLLSGMVMGTLLDPLGTIGIVEPDWNGIC